MDCALTAGEIQYRFTKYKPITMAMATTAPTSNFDLWGGGSSGGAFPGRLGPGNELMSIGVCSSKSHTSRLFNFWPVLRLATRLNHFALPICPLTG